jgi:hypothetical protein
VWRPGYLAGMTDTPTDDAATDPAATDADATGAAATDDAGSAAAADGGSDGEVTPDLPGVTAGDADPMDQDTAGDSGVEGREVGLGDGDDVQPGAGAVEPPD